MTDRPSATGANVGGRPVRPTAPVKPTGSNRGKSNPPARSWEFTPSQPPALDGRFYFVPKPAPGKGHSPAISWDRSFTPSLPQRPGGGIQFILKPPGHRLSPAEMRARQWQAVLANTAADNAHSNILTSGTGGTAADAQLGARLARIYPEIGLFLQQPGNAKSVDDLNHLVANIEHWRAVGRAAGSIKSTPLPTPTLWNSIKGIWIGLGEANTITRNASHRQMADWLPNLGVPNTPPGVLGLTPQATNYDLVTARSNATVEAAKPDFQYQWASKLYDSASGLAQKVPSVVIGQLTGSKYLALGMGAFQTGQAAYDKYRYRGATKEKAALGGALEGTIDGVGDLLPMGFLVDKLGKIGKGRVVQFLAGWLGQDLPSGVATTVAKNVVDTAIANPDKTWAKFWQEQPGAVVTTGLTTLMTAGLVNTVNGLAPEVAEQTRAIDTGTALNRAMDDAVGSKTRARAPDTFKNFVAFQTRNTPTEHLFVSADKVVTYLRSRGVYYRTDPFWKQYSKQIDDGLHTGGDIDILTADAAAYLAGTPAWSALRDDVRTSPGGVSMAEARSRAADQDAGMRQQGADMAEAQKARHEAEAPRRRLRQQTRDKLVSNGHAPMKARNNAEIGAHRHASRAKRRGVPLKGDEAAGAAVPSILSPNRDTGVAAAPDAVPLPEVIATRRADTIGPANPRAATPDPRSQGASKDKVETGKAPAQTKSRAASGKSKPRGRKRTRKAKP